MFEDFLSLIFPNSCISCNEQLLKGEYHFCLNCRHNFPRTGYHLEKDNRLSLRLRGKLPVAYALSYLKFIKGGIVQKALYKIKYEGAREAAVALGNWYGHELCTEGFSTKFDLIVPVPMHYRKEKKRGFNQSTCFAEGLSEAMQLPVVPDALQRRLERTSQTNKNRIERWRNVEGIYQVKRPELIGGKRLLLVDDVITTGATFEACGAVLLNEGAKELSVAAIASAQ